jgi:hypothetical protein
MNRLRRNKWRFLAQDTLKGLSKGLNMSSFVIKSILFLDPENYYTYFFITLVARGILSALIKAIWLAYVVRVKTLKLKKVRLNLLYSVAPSAVLFIVLTYTNYYYQSNSEATIEAE